MDNIIETNDLSKDYGKIKAVQSVSIKVRKGEIYGFLGLNGAGKTTTIRMILGMIRPSKGSLKLFGKPITHGRQGPWDKVGYLVEMPYSYPELTVRENLMAVSRLRSLKGQGSVDQIISDLHLNEYEHVKAKTLSLGNNQRLGIAKALIHKPEMLVLDEPSNGLDPSGIVEIRELLRTQALENDVTVFISSHNLNEISKIATRIGIIHKGKLIKEIDVGNLNSALKKTLVVGLKNQEAASRVLQAKGISFTMNDDIRIDDREAVDHPEIINSLLTGAGYSPFLLIVEKEDLETYFLRIIEEVPC